MLLLRNPERSGDAERSENDMNALAILYVNEHLQEILDDAAEQRRAHIDRLSLIDRIRSAASQVKASLAQPLDNRGWMFPALDDSANRS
jgi:hypothetical protein